VNPSESPQPDASWPTYGLAIDAKSLTGVAFDGDVWFPARPIDILATATRLTAHPAGVDTLLLPPGDHDVHAAIRRVEAAGAAVTGVYAYPPDEPDGPRAALAATFTALIRARRAMQRTPGLRLLWRYYQPAPLSTRPLS
jgi:hypothetical protein